MVNVRHRGMWTSATGVTPLGSRIRCSSYSRGERAALSMKTIRSGEIEAQSIEDTVRNSRSSVGMDSIRSQGCEIVVIVMKCNGEMHVPCESNGEKLVRAFSDRLLK